MPKALITGATGQDGFYMSELLSSKGYEVLGTTRDKNKLKKTFKYSQGNKISIVEIDLLDFKKFEAIVNKFNPDEIYNFAASSSGANMFADPAYISNINGIFVTHILETIRKKDKQIKIFQASSREIFGIPSEFPQNEDTPINPINPYGAAKAYADAMIRIYRKQYNLFACSGILFNHESPLRSPDFVSQKIVSGAVQIKLGKLDKLTLGCLDSFRDWGFAGDYVEAMWLILQQPRAEDYVIASGEENSVRDICEIAFSYLGLNYLDFVIEDQSLFRKYESLSSLGSTKKAYDNLNWKPKMTLSSLIEMMVDSELKKFQI
jgi:GDPmannose 4,6-dehydratase